MNSKDFVDELSGELGYSMKKTSELVASVVSAMQDMLVQGIPVDIDSFGRFEVKKKMERVSVIPSTGQRLLIPPKLVLSFKPAAELKEKLQ